MSKAKLDWALFEKAAAAVKQAQAPGSRGPSVGKPGDPLSRGTDSPHWYGNQPKPPSASLLDRLKSFFSTR